MFHTFGWPEALIILTVVIIVFGVGKLPQVGGALGKGIREFRRGKSDLKGELDEWENEEEEAEEASRRQKGTRKLAAGKSKS
ncbi:MAG: twin-arginine translocase TatA/TatE family subunit [Dehalococcoidia bacterium]